jgi:putative MATE family efflux protein
MPTKITYRKIWQIAYPIILGSIIQNIIRVTDTAFLGHVGEIELGAAAVGSVFYMTFTMLGIGFSVGAQIIVARRYGEKKFSEIGETVEHAFYFLAVFSILVIALVEIFLPYLLPPLISSENILRETHNFLEIRFIGLFFAFTNFAFRGYYIGTTRTKVITVTTAVMAVINILFDYLLIFGNAGFPEMGIKGAAWASVIAEFSATLAFILYTLRFTPYKKYALFSFKKFRRSAFRGVMNTSLPVMMQNFFSFAGWLFFFLFVEKMGEHPLAISNIIRSIYVIMLVPIMGFSFTANTLVSYVLGRKESHLVKTVISKTLKLCFLSIGIMVSLNLIFSKTILSVFSDDLSLIRNSEPVLYVISGAAFFIGAGFVFFNAVSGTGFTKYVFRAEGIIFGLYVIITYFLTIELGKSISLVWAVEFLYGALLILVSVLFFKFYPWNKKKV